MSFDDRKFESYFKEKTSEKVIVFTFFLKWNRIVLKLLTVFTGSPPGLT